MMISSCSLLSREAIELIDHAGSGVLATRDRRGGEHMWIGVPVRSDGDRAMTSFLTFDHEISDLVAGWPEVRWLFLNERTERQVRVDGWMTPISGTVWRRLNRWTPPGFDEAAFTVLVTEVRRVRETVSDSLDAFVTGAGELHRPIRVTEKSPMGVCAGPPVSV